MQCCLCAFMCLTIMVAYLLTPFLLVGLWLASEQPVQPPKTRSGFTTACCFHGSRVSSCPRTCRYSPQNHSCRCFYFRRWRLQLAQGEHPYANVGQSLSVCSIRFIQMLATDGFYNCEHMHEYKNGVW